MRNNKGTLGIELYPDHAFATRKDIEERAMRTRTEVTRRFDLLAMTDVLVSTLLQEVVFLVDLLTCRLFTMHL
ncbi:hypothetical protein NC797_08295 [Aquibacillus sp. 3ASR75-11]|uniref:Uncharacterized protein n=1 Tax=Terrihalobacillus insolitus TaxID=2950438 RepID=A0A9X4AM62_9BACI|nr:hypothetical protein [Terrihalobacillus insolitus]MDC3413844.1 hypothetical protein [Terrihalobacillus insolitus]MDC3424509.1 hypothetical protein [Terrihalobacillus insolitus]